MSASLVGSEMCIRDSSNSDAHYGDALLAAASTDALPDGSHAGSPLPMPIRVHAIPEVQLAPTPGRSAAPRLGKDSAL
eukprot:9447051-Alexandrium_andersonii.AAC.1